jgi:hypothetical protein
MNSGTAMLRDARTLSRLPTDPRNILGRSTAFFTGVFTMSDLAKKRAYLTRLYDGYSWHEKVASMSAEQVTAVYLRFQRDGPPKREPKLNTTPLAQEELPTGDQNDQEPTLRLF